MRQPLSVFNQRDGSLIDCLEQKNTPKKTPVFRVKNNACFACNDRENRNLLHILKKMCSRCAVETAFNRLLSAFWEELF